MNNSPIHIGEEEGNDRWLFTLRKIESRENRDDRSNGN